jgi:hypothetical protein
LVERNCGLARLIWEQVAVSAHQERAAVAMPDQLRDHRRMDAGGQL